MFLYIFLSVTFGADLTERPGPILSSQKIDLAGFAYSSTGETATWSQTGGGGVLTVSDGGQVAILTLVGAYVTSNFVFSDDGHGGTFVVDPPLTPNVARFIQAAALLGGGGSLSNEESSLLSSGGGALTSAVIPTGGVSAFG